METKTCPHCNEVAVRECHSDFYQHDSVDYHMSAWVCDDCGRMFFTYSSEEELDE